MYKKFFGLKENPFNVNPDPRYLFLTHHTQEALACLTYGIETRKGFILLTGEVGTGKTTLINKLLEWLHKERVSTAFVFNPAAQRLAIFRFHDGRFRHPLRIAAKRADAAEAEPVAARALSGRGTRRADRGRGAESFAADAGRNSSAHQSGNFHRKTAADRARRAARARTETQPAPAAPAPPAHHAAREDAPAHARRNAGLYSRAAAHRRSRKSRYFQSGSQSRPCTAMHAEFPGSPICYANMPWSARLWTRRILFRRKSSRKWLAISICTLSIQSRRRRPRPYHPATPNGDQPPLIESLLQALNTLVDRLNQAEAAVESERERKSRNFAHWRKKLLLNRQFQVKTVSFFAV